MGAPWTFLHQNCALHPTPDPYLCNTEVEFYMDDAGLLNLSELQRFCAAIIHFEGILNTLLGDERLQAGWRTGAPQMSRAEAIAAVESFVYAEEVIEFMQTERRWGWNVRSMLDYHSIISYKLPQPCMTADDANRVMDIVTSFFRAALLCRDIPSLRRYPVTIHGIRSFMSGVPSNPLGGI